MNVVIKGKPGWNACCQCPWLPLTLQPLLISRWSWECSVLESCTSWNWLSSENGLGAQKRFNPGGRRWSLHVSRVTRVFPCCFSAQHRRQRDDGKQGSWDSILGSNVGEGGTVGEVFVWQGRYKDQSSDPQQSRSYWVGLQPSIITAWRNLSSNLWGRLMGWLEVVLWFSVVVFIGCTKVALIGWWLHTPVL